jgi:hypothetical protein
MKLVNVLSAFALAASGAFAALPSTMLFQGNMSVGGQAPTDPTTLVVSLYDASTLGNKVWEESFANVLFVNGSFAVQLGSSKALPTFDKPLFVQLTAGGKAAASRVPLTSAPYAQHAAIADAVTNVRNAGDTTFLDAGVIGLGADGQILTANGSGSEYRRAAILPKTTATDAQILLSIREATASSARYSEVNVADTVRISSTTGSTGGGSGSVVAVNPWSVQVSTDTLKLTKEGSVAQAPVFRLTPNAYYGGPSANIPVCDINTAGTIIYNSGYQASATSFQGCVYLGAGVGNRYAWVNLNN